MARRPVYFLCSWCIVWGLNYVPKPVTLIYIILINLNCIAQINLEQFITILLQSETQQYQPPNYKYINL
jgi:hypothetical protein